MRHAPAVAAAVLIVLSVGLWRALRPPAGPDGDLAAGEADAGPASPDAPASAALTTGEVAHRGALPERPNLVLVTIDTTRADHLSTYGYERETSPALDRLAAHGAIFRDAYANASWTLPSVSSVLSGVLPSEHGVRFSRPVEGGVEYDSLSSELPSLPRALSEAGYRTIAVVGNAWLRPSHGFAVGFDAYEYEERADLDVLGPVIERRIEGLVEDPRPFFLWVHLIEPHAPYAPSDEARARFWSGERFPALDTMRAPEFVAQVLGHPPTDDELDYLRAAYDAEIRVVTDYVEGILSRLSAEPYVAIVTADHGEEFADHGGMAHGHTLYQEVVHVPLLLLAPGALDRTELTTPVQLLDVLPTFLELAGAPPEPRAQGRSLLPLLRGERFEPRDIVFESGPDVAAVRGILRDGVKYGYLVGRPLERMFDLREDPGEHTDLAATRPELASELRAALDSIVDDAESRRPILSAPAPVLDDEEAAGLRALGYLR